MRFSQVVGLGWVVGFFSKVPLNEGRRKVKLFVKNVIR